MITFSTSKTISLLHKSAGGSAFYIFLCLFFAICFAPADSFAASKDKAQEPSTTFSLPSLERSERSVSPWIRTPHGKGAGSISYHPGRMKDPGGGPKSFDVDDKGRLYILDSSQNRLVIVEKSGSIRPLVSMPKDGIDTVSTPNGLYVLHAQPSIVTCLKEKGQPVVYKLSKSCTGLERTNLGIVATHRRGGFLLNDDGTVTETQQPAFSVRITKDRIILQASDTPNKPVFILDFPKDEIPGSVRLLHADKEKNIFWLKLATTPERGSVLPISSLIRIDAKRSEIRRFLLPPSGEGSPSYRIKVAPNDALYVMNVNDSATSVYRFPL